MAKTKTDARPTAARTIVTRRRRKRITHSPLYAVVPGMCASSVAYSLERSSPDYREGFKSGLIDEIHDGTQPVIVVCSECGSDLIAGQDHDFDQDGPLAEVQCCNCDRSFKVNADAEETSGDGEVVK